MLPQAQLCWHGEGKKPGFASGCGLDRRVLPGLAASCGRRWNARWREGSTGTDPGPQLWSEMLLSLPPS